MSQQRILPEHSYAALQEMAARLRAGLPPEHSVESLLDSCGGAAAAAVLLEAVAAEREVAERSADRRVELVWSGPEQTGAATRDTAAVVRELFRGAERSVLVSGYVVYDGESIFEDLVGRMRTIPALAVSLFLNISRQQGDTSNDEAVVAYFRRRFFERDWPWPERPRVFYDPRSLLVNPAQRAVLHAKCVVVDSRRALVTSANLTEAAQYRNIESGVLVNDPNFAIALARQFTALCERGILREIA